MKKLTILCFFISVIITPLKAKTPSPLKAYDWAVIGAGPAGITAVAELLANKIDKSAILWLDPEFDVGRLGTYYRNVPGNLQAKRLVTYA